MGVAAAALLVALGSQVVPASAVVTYDPDPSDTSGVVRDALLSVELDAASMGLGYNRSKTSTTSTANFSPLVPYLASLVPCRGDDPLGLRDLSPRATVSVSGPNGTVGSVGTPARAYGLLAPSTVADPQPSAPGNDVYRGGDSRGSSFNATFNLEGQPAGTYTITTTTYNRVRETSGFTVATNCVVGTPTGPQTFELGPVVETKTFEYRPWQYIFTDVFGGGRISLNTVPAETQQRVGNQLGRIHNGNQTAFALPSDGTFMLPPDPSACAANPSSCLPAGAVLCDPAAGCDPRVLIVNFNDGTQMLHGVFDLKTRAYIARTAVGKTVRVQASLGTENDVMYKDLLSQLGTAAAEQGLDLASLLATRVQVSNGTQAVGLSVLNGLQVDPTTTPAGIQIFSNTTVSAGLILNVYAALGGTCEATAGDSDPNTPAPDRYTNTAGWGYTVQKSDLVPDVPRVSPADSLGIGGPIYHIRGDFSGPTLLAMNNTLAGVNTLSGEPNGYPVWIEALGLAGSPLLGDNTPAKTMDFLGTALWSASETPTVIGCTTVDFMLGTGVAVYNAPADVFTALPLWTPNPGAEAVKTAIDSAVADVVAQVTTNPVVAGLLEQVVGAVPLPDLPLP